MNLGKFQIEDKIIQYNVIRSKRKTIELFINDKKEMVIKAPNNCSNEFINKFLRDRESWIVKRLQVIEKRLSNRLYLEFKTGERLFYLGKAYPLTVEGDKDNRIAAGFEQGKFKLILPTYLEGEARIEAAKDIILQLYKKMAKKIFKERTDYYSKLIMAPLELLDYVVVHELCHIIHRNHSSNYWQEVEKYMPNYKKWVKWLKEYGYTLQLEWQPHEL